MNQIPIFPGGKFQSDWKTVNVPDPQARSTKEATRVDLVMNRQLNSADSSNDASEATADVPSLHSSSTALSPFPFVDTFCFYMESVCSMASYWAGRR